MGGAGVALHLLQHGVAQRALGQHALDGLFQDAAGETLLQLGEVGFIDAARIAGVAIVLLVFGLVAGDAQLLDIDHDDVIAGIDVRREDGLVLAAQTVCDLGSQAAEHLVRRIDDKPVVLDFMRLGGKCLHSGVPCLLR